MTLLRFVLFLSFPSQGHHFFGLLPAFWLGLRYDLRCVCILLLLLFLPANFRFLDPFRKRAGQKWFMGIVTMAAFFLIFFYAVDFAYYSYLSLRLNASLLNELSDTSISAGMVWQTYPVFRILLLLAGGTWLIRWIVGMAFKRIRSAETGETAKTATGAAAARIPKKTRMAWFAGVFVLLGLGVFGKLGQFPLRWSDAFALGGDYKANLALNPFQSFFSSLKFRHSHYDEARVKEALPVLAPYFGWRSTDSLPAAFSREVQARQDALGGHPNVIVVICESFSGYKSSMWGNPLNTTPFFDSLSRRGIFFDHCFTPSYGTARGVWAVITGIPDVGSPVTTSSRNPLAVDQHTIINDFADYDKYYFLGGSTSWANIRGLLTNNIKGLHLYEQEDYSAPKIDVWGISDKNLFLEANKVLRKLDHPFFAILQTADNHRPYTIPDEDRKTFQSLTLPLDSLHKYGFESNAEMNAFRYTDFGYKTFIDAAKKEKYFANTVFLFVGDHGIAGDVGSMFPRAWTDQRLSWEHVPLMIYSSRLSGPLRDDRICSQVDVLPTLAGLCGISYRNSTFGRDLLDTAGAAGKENELAFVYDFDQGYIGVIRDQYYYRRQLSTGKVDVAPVRNDNRVPAAQDSTVRRQGRGLAEGIFETAKYMLLMNKKKNGE